nr:DegT/DnrJ/EryC1/StrS family aminotransferase [Desulforamulus reducens]
MKYVQDCLETSWISSKGRYVAEFENNFSFYINSKYATTVSNGTVALHLALVALGIGPGDEVIVPTFTYIASVNAIAYTGATPVFVDSLKTTWQMDPDDVKRKITPKTKAIMVVHLYGHPCDMDRLTSIAKDYNLFIVEDCAEAFGSLYKGQHVGTFGDIGTFSFFGNKTITTGEGGMVVTKHKSLHNKLVHLKGQGVAEYRQYWHDVIGFNYRMTNICAAIGLAQLEQADDFIKAKRQLAQWYKDSLSVAPVKFHDEIGEVYHSYWMCSILVENEEIRDPLREHMANAGIETRPLFYPVHTMPMYNQRFEIFPVAEEFGSKGINMPSWPGLKKEQVDFICSTIKNFFA